MDFGPLVRKRTILSEDEVRAIEASLKSEEGRIKLGQAMAEPIRKTVDYQSVGRKFFVIDPLPQGALPYYDKDYPEQVAWQIPAHAHVPAKLLEPERVLLNTFDIADSVRIRLIETKYRRFNVLDRAQERAGIGIALKEDIDLFALINAVVATNAAQATTSSDLVLDRADLIAGFTLVEQHDLVVTGLLMNAVTFAAIRGWGRDDFDPVTQREVLQTGLMGNIWGANLVKSKKVANNVVYFFAEPDFVGVIPIRQDVDTIPDDEPKKLQVGYVVWENIGMSILNAWGVGKLTLIAGAD